LHANPGIRIVVTHGLTKIGDGAHGLFPNGDHDVSGPKTGPRG
jgi:hypothetical protein